MRTSASLRRLTQIAAVGTVLALGSQSALAQKFCVFDPQGAQGQGYANAKDYVLAAKSWGVTLDLKPYTDEGVEVEDFKAGQCDMVAITGLRARQFNQFTGTLDAVGAIESYDQERKVLNLLASPKIEKLMVSSNGSFETVGIFALGAGYAFVKDRSINQLSKAAGKKIAVMDWDKTQAELVQQIGAQAVSADITTYGGKFNNGQVDIIVAPAILYKPFELYKGLGSNGAIARFPIIQLTAQMVTHREKFPADFGQKSREYVAKQIDHNFQIVRDNERDVDPKYWMEVKASEKDGYTKIMREARLRLVKEGFYDKRMLSILKRVRCEANPGDAECAMQDE